MRRIRIIAIAALLLAAVVSPVRSQTGDDLSKQIWFDIDPAYYFDPQRKVYGDIGVRWEGGDNGWWRVIARPSFRTKLAGRFFFSAGIGNFYTFNSVIPDRFELRPFHGLDFNWPRGKLPLRHYIRLEERFDFNTDTWDAKTSLRLRYKLSVSYRFKARRPERFWQATLGGEGFMTLTGEQGQFQEQSRLTLGLDRSLVRSIHYRFELTWQTEGAFFKTGQSVSGLYFRFRFTKSWGQSQGLRKEASS